VLGSILRWPTPENILSHYVTGAIGFHGGALTDFKVVATKHKGKGASGQPPTREHLYHKTA